MENKIHKKNQIELGAKVKNFSTDNSLNKHIYIAFLLLFNVSLVVGLVCLILFIPKWYTIVISILLFAYCILHSIITYLKVDKNHTYELYENYLVVQNLLFSAQIDTKNIVEAKVARTWFDKLLKLKTSTIEVSYKRTFVHKIKLAFLTEQADEVCKIIMNAALKHNKKTSKS